MHPLFKTLQHGSQQLGLSLNDECLTLLLQYQDELVLWNKAYNLTAIREPKEMLVKHLLDSLSILPHLPQGRLLDIGTGGGMPGLIVAICQPERECVLLDANGKKIRFLTQVIAKLKLPHVKAVQTRVEDTTMIQQLGKFDVITSRAFASLTDFIQVAQPYMHAQSWIAAMKGVIPEQELQQTHTLFNHEVIRLTVPHLDEQRHLILLHYPHTESA